jgi:hypothetical protein
MGTDMSDAEPNILSLDSMASQTVRVGVVGVFPLCLDASPFLKSVVNFVCIVPD